MTKDKIIEDLLKKVDNLQRTIDAQNAFVMKMATHSDEREDALYRERMEFFLQIWHAIENGDVINKFEKFFAGRTAANSEQNH